MNTDSYQKKSHWENVYQTKPLETVSWYQPVPETSLSLIANLNLSKDSHIIDVGGGDSLLSEYLLNQGFANLSVLDISGAALRRAQKRLGDRANSINWIESDVLDFKTEHPLDLWHDRAAFHFITEDSDIKRYVQIAHKAIRPEGYLILGTFSVNGPTKCSGLPIRQYDLNLVRNTFGAYFELLHNEEIDHLTPGGSVQKFHFATLKRRQTP
jgi:2-polyprenyl-3-methyl-5-hydroxy-6-metoxy-1,4-benzoquinol methylase